MKEIFVDTAFWVAILNPRDDLHDRAVAAQATHRRRRLVTTDGVLTELQNYFSAYGKELRTAASELVSALERDTNVVVLPQTRERIGRARALYDQRSDKEYSLTDCDSMMVMKERGITEVLTSDEHFAQEGYAALLR